MAILGYVVWCLITLWVCAGAFVVSVFSNGVSGKIGIEAWVLNIIAALMVYGAFKFWPLT